MTKNPDNRRALGRGLHSLLPSRPAPQPKDTQQIPDRAVVLLPIGHIEPNPSQVRRIFQNDRLEELAQSIRANGIIQPIVVRRKGEGFQLVAGERRWRAWSCIRRRTG